MSEYNVRPGNIVQYVGPLPDYRNKPAVIQQIEQLNNEDTYILRVKKWNKEPQEIRAYKAEIWPVTLEKEHLLQLGFIRAKDRDVYSHNGITAIRPQFIVPQPNGTLFDDKGFVIVEKTLPFPFTQEQLAASSTPVTSIDMLQNYYQDKLGVIIDVEQFL